MKPSMSEIGMCAICGKLMLHRAGPLKRFRGRLIHRKCSGAGRKEEARRRRG